jgi:hypothetical protein
LPSTYRSFLAEDVSDLSLTYNGDRKRHLSS